MSGSVRDIRSNLAAAIAHAKMAKAQVKFLTEQGRLLMNEDDFHSIQDLVLIAGNDFATMDSLLGEWHRMGVSGKSFVAARETEKV